MTDTINLVAAVIAILIYVFGMIYFITPDDRRLR